MLRTPYYLMASLACTLPLTAAEHPHHHDHWNGARADGHAPIGVMGDHTHGAGEWMLAYRVMSMHMEGLYDGDETISIDAVLRPNGDYTMVGEEMSMQAHMIGAMYAPNDTVTLALMLPWRSKTMTVRRRNPMMGIDDRFETSSEGLGDIVLTSLINLPDPGAQQHLHAGIGISAPTGSIDETDDTPMGDDTHLAYGMQLGTGTWDLLPSLTYLGQGDTLSWGLQVGARWHLGENDNGYSHGDRYRLDCWGAWNPQPWQSLSLRLRYEDWADIDGEDEHLPSNAAMMNPGADPNLKAGERITLGLGWNLYGVGDAAWAQGHRLAVEWLLPLSQHLDGPQIGLDWGAVLGWQYAF